MSQLVASLTVNRRPLIGTPSPQYLKGFVLALLAALALTSAETRAVMLVALNEAYIAVAVFVAGTLALVYGLERVLRIDLGETLRRYRRWQVPAGALLGAFPGCGGAIIIVTQYTRGQVSFGALVATLTATMGDAMFLLLAREPSTGLAVLALGVAAGSLTGWAIDALRPPRFLETEQRRKTRSAAAPVTRGEPRERGRLADRIWIALMAPGLVVGVLAAFQIEADALLGPLGALQPSFWLGVAGAVLALALWALRGDGEAEGPSCATSGNRVIDQTNFITSWVIFAFLAYELFLHVTGADLGALFALWAPLIPLAAVLLGWLPGCGPPIVVTSLYLSGSLPLSAQFGNALSNDGDALFPALVLAPKAALLATAYSTLPALLVAYGAYLVGL